MTKIIIAVLIVAAGLGVFSTAQGATYAASILRAKFFAVVETAAATVEVHKVVDGKTTCYVTVMKGGSSAISCVK